MAILSSNCEAATILSIDGRLTIGASSTALRSAVQEAITEGNKKAVILDLQALTYVDSAGLGTLAACSAQAKAAGSNLLMANVQARVLQAIQLVCLDRVLALFSSVDAALESLKGSAAV